MNDQGIDGRMPIFDVCIIGGGVVGAAIARESVRHSLRTLLLERCGDVAEGISKANSGVIHAGFNVKPGSLKARLNVEGLLRYPRLAEQLSVPYRRCMKMVIAKDESELPYLERLLAQGNANGSPGLSIIKEAEIRRLEPRINGKYALFSRMTAIISPYELAIAFAENAQANGAAIRLNSEVTSVVKEPSTGRYAIATKGGSSYVARIVVNSAGNSSDRVASLAGEHGYRLYPCKGEYHVIDTDLSHLLRMAVYPVPPADGSGLGVHLTPTINGNIMIGPSADYIDDPEDVSNTRSVMDALKREAYELMPDLKSAAFIKSFAGIRPKLFRPGDGRAFDDFVIEEHPRAEGFINLIGIESPGLTASPAIARHVVENLIGKRLPLGENPRFDPSRRAIADRVQFLRPAEIRRRARKNRMYGEVVCRCERVTKAEIISALDNPLGARTLNAVKKRTHAMMGRCQSGFCLPRIVDIMTNELGVDPREIFKDGPDSALFFGEQE